jgi:hypothetical protein
MALAIRLPFGWLLVPRWSQGDRRISSEWLQVRRWYEARLLASPPPLVGGHIHTRWLRTEDDRTPPERQAKMRSAPTDECLGKNRRSPSGALEIVHIGSLCKPLSAKSGDDYPSELNTRVEKQPRGQLESLGANRPLSCPSLIPPVGFPQKKPFPSPRRMERGIPGGMRPSRSLCVSLLAPDTWCRRESGRTNVDGQPGYMTLRPPNRRSVK